jgi:putative hydrolase of the HAD superfamily
VLELGGTAFHIPYHVTWEHEKIDHTIENERFHQVECIEDLLEFL